MRGRFLALPALLLWLCADAAAEGLTVERVSGRWAETGYVLDARVKFELDGDVLDALNHGVDLNIAFLVRVKAERRWLWGRLNKRDAINFKLGRRPLSNVYVVSGRAGRRQFDDLENALKYLGTIDDHLLLDNAELNNEQHLTGLFRARLNVDNLPPPLRPVSFILNKWQLSSPWRRWTIRRP